MIYVTAFVLGKTVGFVFCTARFIVGICTTGIYATTFVLGKTVGFSVQTGL